ncbi:hypothetical protein F5Y10DRAFT_285382 [Nemania abortiva]|nr:hypothetical protein F5Y10DRAFT_285382 [Nemania abortiva]
MVEEVAGSIGLSPNAVNVSEILPPLSVAPQRASGSPTATNSLPTIRQSRSDSSPVIPIEPAFPNYQDLENGPDQTDHSAESSVRHSTPNIQSPSSTLTGNMESSVSATLGLPQIKPNHGWCEAIGAWGGFVIIGGSITILIVLSFISFLWFGGGTAPEAASSSSAWRSIILGGWVVQAITISTLLLRIVVSTQVASCTSLLAALFLERRSVRVSQLPYFSVARATNDGPRALLQTIIGSGTRQMLFTIEALLMLVLALAMLGLQFSSTILLTDFRTRMVVNEPGPILLNISISGNSYAGFQSYLSTPVLATFGEVSSNITAQPDTWGVSDTKLKQRAMLPSEYPENRTVVRSYEGLAIVANSRVACMPPTIDGIVLPYPSINGQLGYGLIRGMLDYDISFRAVMQNSTIPSCGKSRCEPLLFECALPSLVYVDGPYQSTICIIGAVGGDYWPQENGTSWDSRDTPWAQHSSIYLVLSANMEPDNWQITPSAPLVPISQYDEWVSYELLPMHYVNISMCFANFNLVPANVSMTASSPLSEPTDNWAVPESFGGGTRLSRRLLGTDLDHQSHEERGILTLKNTEVIPTSSHSGMWVAAYQPIYRRSIRLLEYIVYSLITNNFAYTTPETLLSGITSFAACSFCYAHTVFQHPHTGAILADTINHTKRAALSIDTWIFVNIQTLYNGALQVFDKSEEVKISRTSVVQAPGNCWGGDECQGLIAVSVLVFIHIGCVVCITALYLTQTRYSRHGNIWHSVSQLHDDELGDVLLRANNAKDDDIAKLLKKSLRDHLVKIEVSADGSRIGPVKVGDDPNILSKNHGIFTKLRANRAYDFFRTRFSKKNKDS